MSASPNFSGLINGVSQFLASTPAITTTETTLALSSAYTYATSGAAMFTTFFNQETDTLTDIWVKVLSYNGSWASTDGHINLEIREGLNGNSKPGTSLVGSANLTLDGVTTGWIHISGLSIALTAGKYYSLVLGDADGGATNFVTIGMKCGVASQQPSVTITTVTSTANGYNTTGTGNTGGADFVWKVGSNLYTGECFSSTATLTTGTYERGLRFKTRDPCTLVGFACAGDPSIFLGAANIFRLYADSSTPGGTNLLAYTAQVSAIGGASSPIASLLPLPAASYLDLAGNTFYRAVMKPAVSNTVPRKLTIDGSPDSSVIAANQFLGAGNFTFDNSGSWDDTNTASTCSMGPVLVPTTQAAGGGVPMSRIQAGF